MNADGKVTFVEFHWKPKQGLQSEASLVEQGHGVGDVADDLWPTTSTRAAAPSTVPPRRRRFIERCRDLRHWQREQVVDQT